LHLTENERKYVGILKQQQQKRKTMKFITGKMAFFSPALKEKISCFLPIKNIGTACMFFLIVYSV
jgi:hypothetical protein